MTFCSDPLSARGLMGNILQYVHRRVSSICCLMAEGRVRKVCVPRKAQKFITIAHF